MIKPQLHFKTGSSSKVIFGLEIEHQVEEVIATRRNKKDALNKGNMYPKATGRQDIHNKPERLRMLLTPVYGAA